MTVANDTAIRLLQRGYMEDCMGQENGGKYGLGLVQWLNVIDMTKYKDGNRSWLAEDMAAGELMTRANDGNANGGSRPARPRTRPRANRGYLGLR